MTRLGTLLLNAGLIFPLLSWGSALYCTLCYWRTRRHASPVFIPFIGPILLTVFVFVENRSPWWIPLAWILDLGTFALVAASPKLISDWWNTSAFSRLITLKGADGIQAAEITLHSTGHFHLKKSWKRVEGEYGIVELGGNRSRAGD